MKRNLLRTWILLASVGSFIACSGDPSVSPTRPAVHHPLFDDVNPDNGTGVCMYNDASLAPTGTVGDGVKQGDDPATILNCTANDVGLANAQVISYAIADENGNFGPLVLWDGNPVSCPDGRPIQLNLKAVVNETSTAQRFDIGIWVGNTDALGTGNGKTGRCKQFNLTPDVVSNPADPQANDFCGDLSDAAHINDFQLGVIETICQTNPNPPQNPTPEQLNSLHVGSCVAWTETGANRVCPMNTLADNAKGYRWGTLPGNKSKCNCDGFDVPIVILKSAKLEVAKSCSTTGDHFDLLIDGSNAHANDVACGGTTGAQTVSAGTNTNPGAAHTFGENDFTTNLYTSSYSCVNRLATGPQHVFGQNGDAAATGSTLTGNQITMLPNEDVICTFTNARKPQVKLVKVFDPNADPGLVDFTLAGTSYNNSGNGFGDNGTTGFQIVSTGTVAFSEAGHTGTDLSHYVSTWSCDNGASGTGTSGSLSNVAVGAQITCTFVNHRKPQLKLVKDFVPDADPGLVDFHIGASNFTNSGSGYTDGGTTGFQDVTASTNITISETAHSAATVLADYTSTLACDNSVTPTSNTGISGVVNLAYGAVITCTFTNSRQPQVKLIKDFDPDADPGRVDLTLAGTSYNNSGNGFGDLGTTGFQPVSPTGTVSFSEAAHSAATDLTKYVSTWSCDNGASGTGTSGSLSNVGYGAKITCTIVNHRKPEVKLVKDFDPDADPGRVDLTLAGTSYNNSGNGFGDLGTTGFQIVSPTGTVSFSEAAHSAATDLTNYVSTWSCTNGASGTGTSGSVSDVGYGASITCTFVNHRKPQVKLIKDFDPNSDPGLVDFSIAGTTFNNSTNGYGDNGTTGFQNVSTGTVAIGEAGHTGTDLSHYVSTWSCDNGASGTGTSGSLSSVAYGAKITCTFVNHRKPQLKLVKDFNPDADPGRIDFHAGAVNSTNSGNGYGDGGTTGFQDVAANTNITISETAHSIATLLGAYKSTLSCDNSVTPTSNTGTSGVVNLAYGAVVTCTFVNERKATVTINKRENGVLPLVHSWTFEIRTGASTTADGIIQATGTADGTTGVVTFGCAGSATTCTNVGGVANFLPSNPNPALQPQYQLCETGMPAGFHNNFTGFTPLSGTVEGQDNSTECININLGIAGSGVPTGVPDPIDNVQPPGGDARTIGYWKNWSSCTGGKQYTKATAVGGVGIQFTLDGYLPSSPAVFPIGNIASMDCGQAVNLLGKSEITTGTKKASDAAYGMAAQLFAAKLNEAVGADHKCIDQTISDAQALLVTINFTGVGDYLGKVSGPTKTAQKNLALSLATKLDQYNNNTLVCP